jgi:putative endonuclease
MWFVYILLCEDSSLYTGATNDIEKRFSKHQNGKGGNYTRSHKPLKIVHQEKFDTKSEALKREIEIKSWKRDKKIQVLNLSFKQNQPKMG